MSTTLHYHANTHTSGYLPESEVSMHDTVSEAWSFLAEEIERAWDADYEILADYDIDGRMLADDRFMPAHTYAHGASEPGWAATHERSARRLPLIFEVTECDGCDYADDYDEDEDETTSVPVSLIKTAPVSLVKTHAPRFDTIEVRACVCCALVSANSECGCEDHEREPLSLLVPGEVLTVEGEPWFSWRPCLCCGDSLGGDRYDGTILVAVTR